MLGYLGRIYSATLLFDWTGNWTPVMMIRMSLGLIGADHIEAGPVVAGHTEVSLCTIHGPHLFSISGVRW